MTKKAPNWTPEEDALLKACKPVPGRTAKACWTRAHKIGAHYTPVNPKRGIRIDEKTKDLIAEEVMRTRNTRATGRKFNVSYEAVRAVCAERHIAVNPCSRELLGDYVEWGGSKWVWCYKGYWRETTGLRRNLARTLWEHYNGMPVPPGLNVIFKDHDKKNLKKENLVAMTVGEVTSTRLKEDRLFAMKVRAAGCIGRLTRKIREMADPALAKERGRKAADARKRNGSYKKHTTWTAEELTALAAGNIEIPIKRHTRAACYAKAANIRKGQETF